MQKYTIVCYLHINNGGTMLFPKNTLKLLKVFYSHPEQQFYIQELGRVIKKKPGVFQRTLYNLEKQGLLQSCYKANARFFSVNKSHPLYNEFKTIVQKLACIVLITPLVILLSFNPSVVFCEETRQETIALSSLKEAVKIAFKNNKDIQIQEYALKVASADILQARSEFLPKLDFNYSYTRNGAVMKSAAGSKKDVGVFTGYKNDNKMGVNISETIYDGGANIAGLKEAQLGLKEQQETLRATKLNVELEAKRLYYGLLLAYETRRIAEDLVQQAESHYEEVKNNFQQGTSSKFDVLQSKVQVSLLMPQMVNAQNSVDLIVAEFNKLLGLKSGNNIVVSDKLIYSPLKIKEDEFLKEAYLNEPEMILKSLGIDISKWAIKYARAGWLPQIEASSEYFYRSGNFTGNMFNKKHNNWDIGFAVRVPIFDGFSTKAKVDAARAKYMQSVIGKENLADQVAVDVRQACLDLTESASIIKSQEDNLADAREALEISYVRYNNGVGINLDVLDAQVSFANVQKNLSEGIYDYIMACAKLDRLMGRSFMKEEK